MTRVLHADAVIVGDGTTIRDGAVVLDGNVVREVGSVTQFGPRAERFPGVLMPGLVNSHTHLELSGLRGKTPPGSGFVPWLTALQNARAEELEEERDAAIDTAIAAMREAGVVGVGEVTNTMVAAARLSRQFVATIWHEVFGLDRERGLRAVESLEGGIPTPHALYSTHPDVIRALVAHDRPITMHLAEHAAERAFLRDGGGPLRDFYRSRGIPFEGFPIPEKDPIAAARELGVVRPGAALVHLADARPAELDGLAESGAIVVLCPRSNLMIETRLPPLLALLQAGVPTALGTDSLASSPSLDPLAEARALLDRNPDVPAALLIAAATSGGARAIGAPTLGRLAAGLTPGLLHIAGALPRGVDPSAWVLKSLSLPRRLVVGAA